MEHNTMKTALITGAGSGIGKAICMHLEQTGYRILAVSRNATHLSDISSSLKLREHQFLNADLISREGIASLHDFLKVHGLPHTVVCNLSPASPREKLLHLASRINEQAGTEHLQHLFSIMAEVISFQREQKFGRWIGISSMSAHLSVPGMAIYNIQKSSLEQCIKTLAAEEGKYGITANIIAPGFISTPAVLKNYSPDELNKRSNENVMHRIGTPEDVAAAVAFLAGNLAGYITGITLPVNGGNHLGWQYS